MKGFRSDDIANGSKVCSKQEMGLQLTHLSEVPGWAQRLEEDLVLSKNAIDVWRSTMQATSHQRVSARDAAGRLPSQRGLEAGHSRSTATCTRLLMHPARDRDEEQP